MSKVFQVDQTFLPRVILHGGESESGSHPPLYTAVHLNVVDIVDIVPQPHHIYN